MRAGVLVATSLGAFGPLFGSDYAYNATALGDALTLLDVDLPNDQLARGQDSSRLHTMPTLRVKAIAAWHSHAYHHHQLALVYCLMGLLICIAC